MSTDLSSEIKQFAADHESEIKASVMQMMDEYFASSTSDLYHEKWDAGVQEHGPMTESVLDGVNWVEQMTMEFKDAFWYETLILFRRSRAQAQE